MRCLFIQGERAQSGSLAGHTNFTTCFLLDVENVLVNGLYLLSVVSFHLKASPTWLYLGLSVWKDVQQAALIRRPQSVSGGRLQAPGFDDTACLLLLLL